MSLKVELTITCDVPNCNSFERVGCRVDRGLIQLPANWTQAPPPNVGIYCSAHRSEERSDVDTAKEKEIQDDADVENAR